jgi:Pyruvate/2-oxoacid:ferredoxin oxidoreductase gamma subunit
MENEIMLTGVGGQGIQLGAQILARAATLEGREVMYLGTYGGTMRGGNTDSTLVVADREISSPPIVSQVRFALVMHHAFWKPVRDKLRPDATVLVNSTVFDEEFSREGVRFFEVPATRIASDLGNGMAASMVLIAAYAKLSGLVELESLVEAMKQSIPSYRTQHIDGNIGALEAGFAALPERAVPAWNDEGRSV